MMSMSDKRSKGIDTAIVTTNGRVVIPAKLRKKYGIKIGMKIHFTEQGQKILIEPITKESYKQLRGSLKGKGLLEDLLLERKKGKDR